MNESVRLPDDAILSVRGITKAFGSNSVLKGVDVDIARGSVVALIGGNGAGKSTLVKIIMGIYQPDDGDIYLEGKPKKLGRPSASLAAGIYLVPQEPMLFPNMTVEENVLMGFREKTGDLHKRLSELLAHLGWNMDLTRKAATLSIAEQQLVELLRGLMRDAKLLILDEPTSSLTFNEVESLFKIVADLKAKGISIIYITHRLTEVFQIADQVLIMRDGVITLNGPVSAFTREMLVAGLLPPNVEIREVGQSCKPVDYADAKPALVIEHLAGYGFSDVSLKVYPGEVLGLAGVVGAGRTELATTVFGRDIVKKRQGAAGRTRRDRPLYPGDAGRGAQLRGGGSVPERYFQVERRGGQHHRRQPAPHEPFLCELPQGARHHRPFHQGFPHQGDGPRSGARLAVRRQPAEGGYRPLAGDRPQSADPGRADPRHRRGGTR